MKERRPFRRDVRGHGLDDVYVPRLPPRLSRPRYLRRVTK